MLLMPLIQFNTYYTLHNSPGAAAPSLVYQFFLLDYTLVVRAAL